VKVLTMLLQITLLISIALCANAHSPTYGQRTGPLAIGEVAPDFTLQDHNGQKVTLSDARGKSPVVLVFYRGYW
jgi:cytochrome oxidase Cu insertion factor (SCO1/SenC/PrrC family)